MELVTSQICWQLLLFGSNKIYMSALLFKKDHSFISKFSIFGISSLMVWDLEKLHKWKIG